jgi:predicted AlkP superfamily pyrophosphatase or phosphodiesterase
MRLVSIFCGALLLAAPASAQRSAPWSAPRVLLIGLDGFRADYLDRPAAVQLRALAARGVRAERMIPAFPSKTFPNHYSIVTGLFPEHHGIVANAMRDSVLGLFRLSDRTAVQTSAWWGGEPIWVTAERQGRRAATYFWPGSEAAIGGVRPSWWYPYDGDRPNAERERQVLEWLALPADSAPAFIALYFSDTDDAGHRHGPAASQVDSAIARVDSAVGRLVAGIARLGLSDQVNVIVVADHGMSAVAPERTIVLDDYLDLTSVEIVDLNPVAMITPRDGDVSRVMRAVQGAHPRLQVYRRDEVPARYRFRSHPRITPIVAIADDGWSIVARGSRPREVAVGTVRGGAHGYDPQLASMGALFIAAGPGIAQGRTVPAFQNIHVYPLMAELLRLRPAPTDGALDSVRTILRTRGASSP